MRLIDVDNFKKNNPEYLQLDIDYVTEVTVEDVLDDEPTVDAEPVVRCKDCKFYGTPKNFKKPYCMRGAYVKVNADDYCSKGERQ